MNDRIKTNLDSEMDESTMNLLQIVDFFFTTSSLYSWNIFILRKRHLSFGAALYQQNSKLNRNRPGVT